MGQKHLHELLQEDQEPFQLKHFIADRRSQLKPTTVAGAGDEKTELVVQKRKPIIKRSTGSNFCINHACLFSVPDSPEFKNSPFLNFPAREFKEFKSPCNINKNNNASLFLNIPARTAAMLVDAASRVHKPQKSLKTKRVSKQIKLGLFGTFIRRLKDRSTRTKRCEIGPVDGTRPGSPEMGKSREKTSEMEVSCASRSVCEFEEIDCLWSNASSPFRFSLERSPSPTRRKMGSPSPVVSPSRHLQQDKESYEVEVSNRQDDEEKEQCSPVSVLDPLFDEDEEEHDRGAIEENDYDIECCYANVQRAKHQLLQKLKRFERLAGLDPIDLESRMIEHCSSEEEDVLANEEVTNDECFREIVNHIGVGKIPWYMKKLVFDLIEEENKNEEHEMIVQRVCRRLNMWKMVDLYTIDMIVETDFIGEGWKCCDKETIRDVGRDIEMSIFEFLMEELVQQLLF